MRHDSSSIENKEIPELEFHTFRFAQDDALTIPTHRTPLTGTRSPHQSKIYTATSGINPLVRAASPLLATLSRLKEASTYSDRDSLHQKLMHEITAFETAAHNNGFRHELIVITRYILCATLDEAIAQTPWGNENQWRDYRLLMIHHKESTGDERFFSILERASEDPAAHIDLLELMYLCLSLGFEGKFRTLENGKHQLDDIKDHLFHTIRLFRGNIKKSLLIQNHGVIHETFYRKRRFKGLLIIVMSLALMTSYASFNYMTHLAATPIYQQLTILKNGTS